MPVICEALKGECGTYSISADEKQQVLSAWLYVYPKSPELYDPTKPRNDDCISLINLSDINVSITLHYAGRAIIVHDSASKPLPQFPSDSSVPYSEFPMQIIPLERVLYCKWTLIQVFIYQRDDGLQVSLNAFDAEQNCIVSGAKSNVVIKEIKSSGLKSLLLVN
jgi:hypothetical protein